MVKKLQPGDRYNKLRAKKKARVVKKDPEAEKYNESLLKIAKGKITRKKVAIMGLV